MSTDGKALSGKGEGAAGKQNDRTIPDTSGDNYQFVIVNSLAREAVRIPPKGVRLDQFTVPAYYSGTLAGTGR